MNYLAHTFLSYSDEQIVGNIIGDFIKNKNRYDYPEGIQQGITLHRAIDALQTYILKFWKPKSFSTDCEIVLWRFCRCNF